MRASLRTCSDSGSSGFPSVSMTSVTGPVFVTVAALILSLATSANAGRVSPFADLPANEKSTAGLPDPDVHLALSNSWHQLPNLTAEQRSYAVLLSISRFQDAPNLLPSRNPFNISDFRQNANSANSLAEKPAPNSETGSRRVLHQLSGYYEFMVEQARGIFGHSQKPKSVGSNERPTQDTESEFEDIDDLKDDADLSPDSEFDADMYESDSEDVEDSKDHQDLHDLKDFADVEDLPNLDIETEISVDLVGASVTSTKTLAAVSTNLATLKSLLVDAMWAGKAILPCRSAMKLAKQRVNRAVERFARRQFAQTQGLIWATKDYLSICLTRTTPLNVNRGQKLFQAAEKVTFSVLHDLSSLIFDGADGNAARTQQVLKFESWPQNKASQTEKTANGYRLKFDPKGSAQIRSTDSYATGEFSATIKGPSGNSKGTTTAFYLSTPPENPSRYAIILEIPYNNRHRINMNTVSSGKNGLSMVVDTGVDLGADFHDFKIVWSPSRIVWYMDGQPLRVLENEGLQIFPLGTRMQLYMAIAVTATFCSGPSWAPYVNVSASPFYAEFQNVKVISPNYDSYTLPQSMPLSPVAPFVFDYCSDNMMAQSGVADITYYDYGCGGRWHTTIPYQSGEFSTKFKCAAGNTSGLVSSFYLSSREGKTIHDEIDFEWLGKNNYGVQTNFYVHGYGAGANEVWIPTKFDCSDDYHTYLIRYNAKMIQWFIDGDLVRTVKAADVPVYPYKPMFLYGSIWDASSIMNGKWSGNFTYSKGDPWTVSYRDMTIKVPA